MWYRTGTITVANGSATVTGAGTAFVDNVRKGQALITIDGRPYEIASVNSDTQITLAQPYQGSSAGALAYAILPARGMDAELHAAIVQQITEAQEMLDGPGQGAFPDGTAAAPGIRFGSDQDTGLFRIGANILGVAAGGVKVGEIYSLGWDIDLARPVGGGFGTVSSAGPFDWNHASHARSGNGGSLLLGGATNGPTGESLGYFHPFSFEFGPGNRAGTGNLTQLAIPYATGASFLWLRGRFDGSWNGWRQILGEDSAGAFRAATDNAKALGSASYRFSTVYAGTGSINTSDAREKQAIGGIPDAWLDAWGNVEWCRFKFCDAVAAKGDDARWHIGMIAQQVRDAFAARDLDAIEIGLLCHDAWDAEPALSAVPEIRDADGKVTQPAQPGRPASPAGDRWGLRYDECQAIEAAWHRREIARQRHEIDVLRGMIAVLQG